MPSDVRHLDATLAVLAREAITKANVPVDRVEVEVEALLGVLRAEAADMQAAGIDVSEVRATCEGWAHLRTGILATHYAEA